MAEVLHPQVLFRVDIIESERDWGQKIDETKYFDNEPEAVAFCQAYNAQNPAGPAPDWYMQANYMGRAR